MQWATDECKIIQIQAAAATYMCVRLGQSKAFLHALNNLPDNLFLVFFLGKWFRKWWFLDLQWGARKSARELAERCARKYAREQMLRADGIMISDPTGAARSLTKDGLAMDRKWTGILLFDFYR